MRVEELRTGKRIIMKKYIILSIVLITSQICYSGEMYKWTDKNGVVRFTNTAPPQDAQKVGKETNYVAQPITEDSQKPDYLKYDRPSSKETRELDSNKSTLSKPSKPSEYKFSWSSPRVSGDELSISGRVDGGEKCNKLTVDVFLFDEKGNVARIVCQANDVGGSNSRIIEGKKNAYSSYGSNWNVKSQYPNCVSP